jgi:hypothetical protein
VTTWGKFAVKELEEARELVKVSKKKAGKGLRVLCDLHYFWGHINFLKEG